MNVTNEESAEAAHWGLWVIGAVALIWNVMGLVNFLMQMNADAVAAYPETHRAIIEGRPAWATGGFAVAVIAGAVGCLLLLLRRPAAYYLFIASLLGVLVTMIHTLRVAASTVEFSVFEMVMMMLMPVLVAAFLIWYSKYAERQGWIG